ncbi:fibronectin type III domain-containing protein [Mycobacterium heckeshornense]|uniref:fibronectin type III domain-containing protein n=1 Tax=Mycobacterium heckeshornense TaxID=110505 RepID=UPI0006627CDF|nr:fibronectin type III domain-containing protein [Mycobacterium heckeshornense]KMV23338.1 hypothetical protein ACT16_06595 [Mycobacterium heckeshornense]
MTTPLQDQSKPFGLHKVMLTPYVDADGTVLGDTSYPLPISQTLAFSETEDFVTLDGDDKSSVAVAGKGATVDGSLEAGGISLQAWSILTGGQVSVTGVAPNRQRTLLKKGSDQRPYFRVDGLSRSTSGGDVTGRIFRCKCNGKIQGDMKFGTFQMTKADFTGTPMPGDDDDYLYQFTQHESRTSLPATPEPNPLPIPSNVTVGTVTASSIELSWNDIPTADSYKVQQSTDNGATWTDVSAANGGQPTSPSTTVSGLAASTAYQFRVAAVFGSNTGRYSSPVSATTAS